MRDAIAERVFARIDLGSPTLFATLALSTRIGLRPPTTIEKCMRLGATSAPNRTGFAAETM
jgi:hypothetical protein